jgi:catechol 2,3-dioxygenase-like lactoylglutathione lyase family enzyme
MEFLGWKMILEEEKIVGFSSGESASIWFLAKTNDSQNNYDGIGVNHIGIGVNSIEPVNAIVDYLADHAVKTLFGTPRYRPEFSGADNIYYQVMFESPDKILFEVVCAGPKNQ